MSAVEIVPRQNMTGKKPQLTHRSTPLALQTALGKPGFLCSDLGDSICARFDLVRNGVQECGTIFAARMTKAPECILSGSHGLVHQRGRSHGKGVRWSMRRIAGKGAFGGHPLACDQVLAMRSKSHFILVSLSLIKRVHRPQRNTRGSSGFNRSMSRARIAGCSGSIGWRQNSEEITPPSTIAALVERQPHWRFS